MTSSGQNVSRSRWLIPAVTVGIVMCVGGVCNLFAQTNTEHNAEKALSDLQIDVTATEPNVPIPEIYTTPPKIIEQIVGGKPESKLLYFCRHHTSDELKKIIHEQFATKIFDPKGKSIEVPDYKVSSNPATNQLIVRCPAREDADAVLELLEMVDVPPIQIKIDCLVSEIFADSTFDRETTILIEKLFGEAIWAGPKALSYGAGVTQLISEEGETLAAFPGASLRELLRARMGLKIGYSEPEKYTALIDLLESKGYLKILMNPVLTTVNGKTAMIKSTQNVPLQIITKYIPSKGEYLPQVQTEYKEVIDSLEVTPYVYADGYIGLETSIILGAKNIPDGVKQVPIITKREITSKENRIRPGESLIIGGIRRTEEFGVVRGVPLLKDIPLIGFLFSGEDTEQRAIETVFILTPTYSTGGRPKKEVMEEVRKKHEPAPPGGLQKTIKDIFGGKSRKEEQQRKAQEGEQSRLDTQVEKALVRNTDREAEAQTERVKDESQKATSDAAKTKADAEKLMAEAKKLIAEAEAKAMIFEAAKAAADQVTADAKKALAEAETAKAEADAKGRDAEKARQEAEAEKAKAIEQQAKADTDKPKEESKQAEKPKEKADSEETKEDAEKAKAEEDNAEPEA